MLADHSRIIVIGSSGAGKSTFAKALAAARGVPHLELDHFHWGPNWTERPDFRERIAEAVQQDAWISDGNYDVVRDIVWPRATAAVWLNYSFPLVFRRALTRTVRRIVDQKPIAGGNRENWRMAFLNRNGIPWWVIRTFRLRRREFRQIFDNNEYPNLTLFEACRPKDGDRLLRGLD